MYKKILLVLTLVIFSAQPLRADKKKTICLNMIVKDERDVIERCLASVKGLIDYWVIFDTGSTDGTQEIIKNYLKDIPGELHESPWVNFEHNRNEALAAAKGKGDYIFLIDADEILEYESNFKLPVLDKDVYQMTVRQIGAANCIRTGLINNKLNWQWKGVLHEILTCSEAKTYGMLEGVVNICNAAIGARSKIPATEKYLKDAKTLEEALKEDPENSRYVYYLGVSYSAAEKYKEALKAFQRRISMNSIDTQETYMAIYNCGLLCDLLKRQDEAMNYFFQASNFHPGRAEPLFQLATLYRKQGNYLLGYLLSKHALTIPYPSGDSCIDYTVYDYRTMIEFANCTLLLGRFGEALDACQKLLANPNLPENVKGQVTSNFQLAWKNVHGALSTVSAN